MANKIRDIFDDDMQELSGIISFVNAEKHNDFINALKTVMEEGKPSTIDGINNISISMNDGDSRYPINERGVVTEVTIYPEETPVDIRMDTNSGIQELHFLRKLLKNKIILRSIKGKGALIEIVYDVENKIVNVKYKADYSDDYTVEEMIEYYNTLFLFSKKFFSTDDSYEQIDTILNYFLASALFFERVNELSKLLNIEISPTTIGGIKDDDWFIEKAYFSLIEGKIIRSNRKINSMNNVCFPNEKRPGENPMIAAYMENGKLFILNKEIAVYSANVAFNIILEKEEVLDGGGSKLYFRDSEENPMFISSVIMTDEGEAQKALIEALDNKTPYLNAKTLIELIKEAHEDRKRKKLKEKCEMVIEENIN